MSEIWTIVPKTNGKYQASTTGNIRRSDNHRLLSPSLRPDGYLEVRLRSCGVSTLVHRIVLSSFSENENPDMDCCHYDGNKKNNSIWNLYWGTRKQNLADSIRLKTWARGDNVGAGRLKDCEILLMCKLIDAGIKKRIIAKIFKVCPGNVSAINHGYSWNWLTNRNTTQANERWQRDRV